MAETGRIKITGTAEAYATLAKDLRRAGSVTLRKELFSGLQRAARPVLEDVRAAATAGKIPRRGGLAARVAKGSITAKSVRNSGNESTVRITAKSKAGAKADFNDLNNGKLRHPVFGNRGKWRQQKIPAGWFDDGVKRSEDYLRRELDSLVQNIERIIAGG